MKTLQLENGKMIPASGFGQDSGDNDVKIELEGDEIVVAEKIKVN